MIFGNLRNLIQGLANKVEWQGKTNNAAHSAIMSQLAKVAADQKKILQNQEAFGLRQSFITMPHPSLDKEPKS